MAGREEEEKAGSVSGCLWNLLCHTELQEVTCSISAPGLRTGKDSVLPTQDLPYLHFTPGAKYSRPFGGIDTYLIW